MKHFAHAQKTWLHPKHNHKVTLVAHMKNHVAPNLSVRCYANN